MVLVVVLSISQYFFLSFSYCWLCGIYILLLQAALLHTERH